MVTQYAEAYACFTVNIEQKIKNLVRLVLARRTCKYKNYCTNGKLQVIAEENPFRAYLKSPRLVHLPDSLMGTRTTHKCNKSTTCKRTTTLKTENSKVDYKD